MKHVKIKQLSKGEILDGYGITADFHPSFEELTRRAFGVDQVKKDPETGRNKVYLLHPQKLEVFGWIFEDLTETI